MLSKTSHGCGSLTSSTGTQSTEQKNQPSSLTAVSFRRGQNDHPSVLICVQPLHCPSPYSNAASVARLTRSAARCSKASALAFRNCDVSEQTSSNQASRSGAAIPSRVSDLQSCAPDHERKSLGSSGASGTVHCGILGNAGADAGNSSSVGPLTASRPSEARQGLALVRSCMMWLASPAGLVRWWPLNGSGFPPGSSRLWGLCLHIGSPAGPQQSIESASRRHPTGCGPGALRAADSQRSL